MFNAFVMHISGSIHCQCFLLLEEPNLRYNQKEKNRFVQLYFWIIAALKNQIITSSRINIFNMY